MADARSLPVQESFLDEGFILDKKIGVGQPKRIENAKILVANTAMDTDKIKIYGARVRVDSMQKVHCSVDPHSRQFAEHLLHGHLDFLDFTSSWPLAQCKPPLHSSQYDSALLPAWFPLH